MLKIHEGTGDDGELSAVFLRYEAGVLEVVSGGVGLPLPDAALGAAMARYGAPFDPEAEIHEVARLAVGPDRVLRHVRHLAGYDVIARDYVVYETSDAEALCALATTVSAALVHLGRVAARP